MIRLAVLSAVLGAVLAAPAGAATVTWTEGDQPPADPDMTCGSGCRPTVLEVVDAGSERNDMTLSVRADGRMVVRDTATPPVAGAGCVREPDGTVSCPSAGFVSVKAGGGGDVVVAPMGDIEGGDGDDTLTGTRVDAGPGADTVTGTDRFDILNGGPGPDTVNGLGGNDTINDGEAAPGADRLDGGNGLDTLTFTGRQASVRVDLAADPQTGGSAGEENVLASFEAAAGGDGADDLLGPTRASPDRLFLLGGAGNDRLFARSPSPTTLRGGAGDDELIGGPAAETFEGEDGDDRVSGAAGDDRILGGDGGDQLDGEDGADQIFAGEGADTATGGDGRDNLSGGRGIDTLVGDAGNDVLRGGQGTDELTGGTGRDRLYGGSAGDRLDGGLDADRLDGGKGRDRMLGAEGPDRLSARDGERDRFLDCGPDEDIAVVDRREPAPTCERTLEPKPRRRG